MDNLPGLAFLKPSLIHLCFLVLVLHDIPISDDLVQDDIVHPDGQLGRGGAQ